MANLPPVNTQSSKNALWLTVFAVAAFAMPALSQAVPDTESRSRLSQSNWTAEHLRTASTTELVRNFLPEYSGKIVGHDWRRFSPSGPRHLSLYERSSAASEWVCMQSVHQLTFWPAWDIDPKDDDPTGFVLTARDEDAIFQIAEAGSCHHHGNDLTGFRSDRFDFREAVSAFMAARNNEAVSVDCGDLAADCAALFKSLDVLSLRLLSKCGEPGCMASFSFPPSNFDRGSRPYGWDVKLYSERRIVIRPGRQPALS